MLVVVAWKDIVMVLMNGALWKRHSGGGGGLGQREAVAEGEMRAVS